jgi:hypothetical protein
MDEAYLRGLTEREMIVTRKQMEAKIEELSEELRQLKAKDESHGHCHGCHCGHVIYYPWYQTYQPTTLPLQWSATYTSNAGGGNYQITNG